MKLIFCFQTVSQQINVDRVDSGHRGDFEPFVKNMTELVNNKEKLES